MHVDVLRGEYFCNVYLGTGLSIPQDSKTIAN